MLLSQILNICSRHQRFFFFCCHCFVSRYVENICKNPTEEKYRKIKLSNKVFQVCNVPGSRLTICSRLYGISIRKQDNFACLIRFLVLFQEKVKSVEGSREFLQALGFTSVMLPIEGQGK